MASSQKLDLKKAQGHLGTSLFCFLSLPPTHTVYVVRGAEFCYNKICLLWDIDFFYLSTFSKAGNNETRKGLGKKEQ